MPASCLCCNCLLTSVLTRLTTMRSKPDYVEFFFVVVVLNVVVVVVLIVVAVHLRG